MEVFFGNRKLCRIFSSGQLLLREYGQENGRLIMRRMSVLMAAPTLSEVPATKPERRHELTNDRAGQFAVDVKQPYRLVFVPLGDPVPRLPEGGYDLARITAIEVLALEDYH